LFVEQRFYPKPILLSGNRRSFPPVEERRWWKGREETFLRWRGGFLLGPICPALSHPKEVEKYG
jgi:hypothetical protein